MFYILLFLIFILGLSIGSFINAFEWRLYREKDFIKGRSQCIYCDYELQFFDLIPIVSFVFLRGRCRNCHKKISWQYPLVELITGILFVLIFFYVNNWQPFLFNWSLYQSVELFKYLFIVSVLIFIFIFDYKYYLIPDVITIPSFVIIVSLSIVEYLFFQINDYEFVRYLLAILIGSGFFYFQYIFSRGRWVGGGDIRLGALMGSILSFPLILVALFIAYILGSIVSVILLLAKKKNMKSVLPFGTFLSLATLITILWGKQFLEWYLNLFL